MRVTGWFLAAMVVSGVLGVDLSRAAEPAGKAGAEGQVASVEAKRPDDGKLRIIVFGAHPDDSEETTGGTAALWAAEGHHVKMVSVTNGDIGHYRISGARWPNAARPRPRRQIKFSAQRRKSSTSTTAN